MCGLMECEVELHVKRLWALVASMRLIVDLMFSEMLLQLALSGEDLRAYRAFLVLEFSIAETFRLTFTGIRILT